MVRWSLIFLTVALLSAALGFTGVAAGVSSLAQLLFLVFLVLFVVALVGGGARGRRPL
jgi:uncharacterized membrane protein YtjA (UPF0391 family)